MRRADDHGRALVVGDELGARDEAEGIGHTAAEGAVAHDHARHPLGRLDEVEDPLLLGESPDEQHARWLVRLADRVGNRDPARHDAHLSRAELARGRRERLGRAEHDAGSPQRAFGPPSGHAPASSTSVPHSWRTNGLRVFSAGRADGSQWAWTRSASRAARRAAIEYEARNAGTQERLPRASPEVPDDAVPVREPEVPKRGGRDDLDVDAGAPQLLHRLAHEHSSDVVRPARVRRRENDDLHSRRRRATMGSAAASVANT